MSWISRIKNAFINLTAGQPADLDPVVHPTTNFEIALNAASATVLPIAAKLPGASAAAVPITAISKAINTIGDPSAQALQALIDTLAKDAGLTVGTYLGTTLGPVGSAFVDPALEALASAALQSMTSLKGKSAEDIDAALDAFLAGLKGG